MSLAAEQSQKHTLRTQLVEAFLTDQHLSLTNDVQPDVCTRPHTIRLSSSQRILLIWRNLYFQCEQKVMVIAFCITAIKGLIGRLFPAVIMYKIINQLCSAIIGDTFNQVYFLLASLSIEKENKLNIRPARYIVSIHIIYIFFFNFVNKNSNTDHLNC